MALTHVDQKGEAHMVDISDKKIVHREATASGCIFLQPATIEMIKNNLVKKGDVLSVARIAAINGAKKTFDLIPLCHPIPLTRVSVELDAVRDDRTGVEITATAETVGRTGVEM